MEKIGLILLTALIIAGCGNTGKNENTVSNGKSDERAASAVNQVKETVSGKIQDVKSGSGDMKSQAGSTLGTKLPEYKYTGNDGIIKVICDYLKENNNIYGKDEKEVFIPSPIIFLVNDNNKKDIQVFGNFWTFYYSKEGNNLVSAGGGEKPGRFHIKKTGNDYEISSFDKVGDGSNYAGDIKKICEDTDDYMPSDYLYNLYMNHNNFNSKEASYTRKVFIERYVEDNGLDIVSFQDEGRDKVMLEPVKKASFEGKLYKDTGEIFYFMTCGTMDFSIGDVVKNGEPALDKNQTNFAACDGQRGMGENKIGLYYGKKLHIFETD